MGTAIKEDASTAKDKMADAASAAGDAAKASAGLGQRGQCTCKGCGTVVLPPLRRVGS